MANLGDIFAALGGHPVNRPQLNAFVAQSQELNGLRSAQTEEAMENARKAQLEAGAAQTKQEAMQGMEKALIATGMDPAQAHLMVLENMAGLDAQKNAESDAIFQKTRLMQVVNDPTSSSTTRFLAQQALAAIEGKQLSSTESVPNDYIPTPGAPPIGPVQLSPTGAAGVAAANANAGLHTAEAANHAGMASMAPEDLQTVIRLTASGQMPMPNAYMMSRNAPQALAIIRGAEQLNPNITAQLQPQIAATVKDFSGAGQNGRAVQGYRTVEGHLQLFEQSLQALNNGDNQVLNQLGNKAAAIFGAPAPAAAALVPQFIATEAFRALSRNGIGSLDERNALDQKINTLALSPTQGPAVADQMRQLLATGKNSLAASYQAGTAGHAGGPGVPTFDQIYNGTVGQPPAPAPAAAGGGSPQTNAAPAPAASAVATPSPAGGSPPATPPAGGSPPAALGSVAPIAPPAGANPGTQPQGVNPGGPQKVLHFDAQGNWIQ